MHDRKGLYPKSQDVSDSCKNLILRLLDEDIERRPESIEEILRDPWFEEQQNIMTEREIIGEL